MGKKKKGFVWEPRTYEDAQRAIKAPIFIPDIRNAIRLGFPVACPPPSNDPNGKYEVQDNEGVLAIVKIG